MGNNDFLYIYGCNRDDGFNFAVGTSTDESPANGSRALFQRVEDAHLFAYAVQERDGTMVHILPSAELPTTT